jgi:thioesterase domain-containing protein
LYLGRDDQQVKLRGHRIEFGELESALASHASVAQCAATVLELDAQDRRLVAYVVPSEGCDADAGALRDSLRSRLPEYLVPQHIVFLPELPTTPNGKLDRRALPPPGPGDATLAPVVVEPESLLEQLLVDVWCRVLRRDHVGVMDNFFELGGHSLLAVRLVQAIGEACRARFSPRMVFEAPTIRRQARWIDSGRESSGASVVPLHAQGTREPLFCICGIYLYQPLARLLDADRPVYGIFLPVEDLLLANELVALSVVDMARQYATAIRERQPHGPYHLAGVSFGGVLAYETAQQLRAAGETVALVAILDVVLPRGIRRTGLGRMAAHVPEALRRSPRRLLQRFVGERSAAERRAAHVAFDASRVSEDDEALKELRQRHYRQAWLGYQQGMQPYDGTVVIFPALDEVAAPLGGTLVEGCGWLDYVAAERLHEYPVPGDHLGILAEPYVSEVADRLREHLGGPAPTDR